MKYFLFLLSWLGLHSVCSTYNINPVFDVIDKYSILFNNTKDVKITCNIEGAQQESPASVRVAWVINDKNLTDFSDYEKDKNKKDEEKRFTTTTTLTQATLRIKSAAHDVAGNGSCQLYINDSFQSSSYFFLASTINVKIKTENINVVEGEELSIECSVLGSPYPTLAWSVQSENHNGSVQNGGDIQITNYTDTSDPQYPRIVQNGRLIISKVTKADRGEYFCNGTNQYSDQYVISKCMVRVKDTYAALWPFLGICVEVIVLCAIIIIYEKKRNKTELEESDTDQSPDQKNTPDHGKDPNLRHRQ